MALSLRQPKSPDTEIVPNGDGPPRPRQGGPGHGGGGLRGRFVEQPFLNSALVLLCVAAIVLAMMAIGPASQSSGQTTRTSTVKRGVVQSTVSGSGNVKAATELDLGFKTSGTVTHIYVKEGQQVAKGQLLATLEPQDAEVTLEQAKASLQSAEASLAALEENEGESTSSQGGMGATASAASVQSSSATAHTAASDDNSARSSATPATATTPTTTTPTTTTPTTTTPTTTTPTTTTPTTTTPTTTTPTTTTPTTSTPAATGTGTGSSTGSESKKTQSAATREANLASSEATVKTDRLTVKSDEQAVQNTKLYAPEDGTIVSLSGEVGQTVSATGTTKASSSSSSSSASSSSTSGLGKAGSTGSSTPSSSEGASSGSTFMVLSDLNAMRLVVSLSESEIGNVHVGQIATLTIEALNGQKLAAHVTHVAQTSTSTSGAASYDVTFKLDQGAVGLKVGMSATAEVVIKQAEGVNVPTSAIKGGSVTVLRHGKQVSEQVTTGLAGDSSTIILSGVKAGETVVLPSTATATATATGTSSSGASPFGSRGKSASGGLGSSLGGGGFPSGGPPSGGFPGGAP
jgi:multidrug efflux pump subunit AcrA (membrane-fusion protein)